MKTQPIRLSFQCDQNWDEMSPTGKGRFCKECSCEVVDFRSNTREEVKQYVQENDEKTCGLFRPAQLDPNIIAELHTPTWLKSAMAVASMGILAASSPILAQNTHYLRPTITIEQPEQLSTDSLNIEIEKTSLESEEDIDVNKPDKELLNLSKRTVFLTRKFPFIKVEKYVMRGMGCPKF